jgi:asparagine synthase (glutamine-hydrolysing)
LNDARELLGERLHRLPIDGGQFQYAVGAGDRALADLLDHELKTYFVAEFMTKIDGATMHYGLEARSPFLDQFLWEFASSLPFDVRLRQGRLKAVLRELVRRRISGPIARRRKRGFGIPVRRWIAGRWHSQVEATFRDSILGQQGWINSSSALQQLQLSVDRGWAPDQLWYLFVLESWMRHERANTQIT